ncbi:MAG: M48 family metallopeptidase [Lysobacteraceae bacterium]
MTQKKARTIVLGVAFGLACPLLLAGCATTTSSTGRTQYVGAVSQDQLDQLGVQAFNQEKGQKPLSQDARQNAYVRCVVDSIVRELSPQWRQTGWESAVFVDKTPNAFALPGGKVGVYTGIFDVAKSQGQLAAVIGHEIGHVVERHHDERITRQYGAQAALSVASLLAGSRYGEGVAQGVSQSGGLLLQTTFLLPGTREQENEADIVGQRLMAQAGYDPHQAIDLWQNMLAASASRPPQWLSTHPDPKSRIGEMRKRADSLMPVYEQARASGRKPTCG